MPRKTNIFVTMVKKVNISQFNNGRCFQMNTETTRYRRAIVPRKLAQKAEPEESEEPEELEIPPLDTDQNTEVNNLARDFEEQEQA